MNLKENHFGDIKSLGEKPSGQRLPKDSENHLCDALRYAFEDVKFFKPKREKERDTKNAEITANDFNGGWNI